MGVIVPVGFGVMKIMHMIAGSPTRGLVTIGYEEDGSHDPAGDASFINGLCKASGRPFLPANYSSGSTYLGVECMIMTNTGPISGTAAETIVGTKSAAMLPWNCAVLMQKNTARGGRMGKGRCFLPPVFVSDTNTDDQGTLDATQMGLLQGYWSSLLTALNAGSTPAVLLHSDGSTPDPITSVTIKPIIATQRRRLVR